MSEPLHVAIREEARERESFYRDDAEDSERAEHQLQIVAVCNTVSDLVQFTERLCRFVERKKLDSEAAKQARDYIKRNNLHGSPLREGE